MSKSELAHLSASLLNLGYPKFKVHLNVQGTFKMYLAPIAHVIKKHKINFHIYADDIQLYAVCEPDMVLEATTNLENCIAAVYTWLSNNWLKCNESKTEVLLLGTKLHLLHVPNVSVKV